MEKQSARSYVSENRNLTVYCHEDLKSQYYNVQQEMWFSLEVPKVRNWVLLGMFTKLWKATISFDVLVFFFLFNLFNSMLHYTVILHALHNLSFS